MSQILSQSVRFYRLYIKNILVCFFGSQCRYVRDRIDSRHDTKWLNDRNYKLTRFHRMHVGHNLRSISLHLKFWYFAKVEWNQRIMSPIYDGDILRVQATANTTLLQHEWKYIMKWGFRTEVCWAPSFVCLRHWHGKESTGDGCQPVAYNQSKSTSRAIVTVRDAHVNISWTPFVQHRLW